MPSSLFPAFSSLLLFSLLFPAAGIFTSFFEKVISPGHRGPPFSIPAPHCLSLQMWAAFRNWGGGILSLWFELRVFLLVKASQP